MSRWNQMSSRERDMFVAIKVMGWQRFNESDYCEEGMRGTRFVSPDGVEFTKYYWEDQSEFDYLDDSFPHYTTNMEDTWEVVEKLRKQKIYLSVIPFVEGFHIQVRHRLEAEPRHSLTAFTATEAICLAALAVNGVDIF